MMMENDPNMTERTEGTVTEAKTNETLQKNNHFQRRRTMKERKPMTRGKLGAIVTGVVIFVLLITGIKCMEKIPAGYVGIVYSMNGGVSDDVLTQGWHLVAPTKEVTLYSVGIEQSYLTSTREGDSQNDDSFEVPTSDGKGLIVDLTFTYRYDPEDVTKLFTRFKGQSGKEVRDSFIKPNIISWTKEVTAKYPVTEILGDERANLNIAISEYIKNKFEPYGIIVENVSLINIDADADTRAAVQRKVTAQQELELAQIEQKTANVQAQKDKEVALIQAQQNKETAEIEAEQAKIKAEGQAEAIRIKAEAEAAANKLIAESLTPELIEKQKIDKWNGDVPKVSGSGASIISIDGIGVNDSKAATE
ncbi:MAG: prohibitin family protein [Blautia sp.]|nr:prohibitin family protein [Blautia sp.]